MENKPGDITSLIDHADFAAAVLTTDHFLPLLYTAGIAAASQDAAKPLVRGYAMGSLCPLQVSQRVGHQTSG